MNAQDFSCGSEGLIIAEDSLDRNSVVPYCSSNEVYWVNLYYHFVSRNDGSGNYTEEAKQPFNGSPYQTGYDRARAIVDEMNRMLQINPEPDPQLQVAGINYPDPYYPTRLQFILKGVNFIKDSNLYDNVTGYGPSEVAPFEIHRINHSNSINVFDTNFRNPKSSNCNCYYTGPDGVGYKTKNMVVQKGFNNYDWYANCSTSPPQNTTTCALSSCSCNPTVGQQCCRYYKTIPDERSVAFMAKLTLHEVGHVINLPHSWSSSTVDLATGDQYKTVGNNYMNYNTDTSIDFGFSEWQIGQYLTHLDANTGLIYDCGTGNCSKPYNAAFLTDLNDNPKTTYSGIKPDWIKINNFNSFNYNYVRVTVCYLGSQFNSYTANSPCAASNFYDVTYPSYKNDVLAYLNSPNWGKYKVTVSTSNTCGVEDKNFLLTIKYGQIIHEPNVFCPVFPGGDFDLRLLNFEALESGTLNIYLIRLRTGEKVQQFVSNKKISEGIYRQLLDFQNVTKGVYTLLITLNRESKILLIPNCN